VSVRARKYKVCGVWKFFQIKKAQNIDIFGTKTLNVFYDALFKIYNQFRCDLTPHMYIK